MPFYRFEERMGFKIPRIASITVSDRSGRTLSGQTLQACYHSIKHGEFNAIGMNCALGAEEMLPMVREMSRFLECPAQLLSQCGLAQSPFAQRL